jgi:4-diphosphocytidyl-2-C-methyl-D-erythritol kinase
VGKKDGYHEIESLVTAISLFDTLILSKREDKKVVIKCKGIPLGIEDQDNNAVKTAKAFIETFNTNGVNIILKKRIPVGAGLGGSSVDIAGVILAMQKLYDVKKDVLEFAGKLGSDVLAVMDKGYKIIHGIGDKVEKLNGNLLKLYCLVLPIEEQILAKDCYYLFDKMGINYPEKTQIVKEFLLENSKLGVITNVKNDLYVPAVKLVPKIKENLKILSTYGGSFMTGSGTATVAVFKNKKDRDKAYRKLKRKKIKTIKVHSV